MKRSTIIYVGALLALFLRHAVLSSPVESRSSLLRGETRTRQGRYVRKNVETPEIQSVRDKNEAIGNFFKNGHPFRQENGNVQGIPKPALPSTELEKREPLVFGGNGRGLSQKEHEYLPASKESLEKREPLVFGGNGRGLSQNEHSILPAGKESLEKREPLVFGGNGRGLSQKEHEYLPESRESLEKREPLVFGGNGRGLSQKEHEYLPESRESLEKREPLVFGGNGRGLSQKEHEYLPESRESLEKREPLVFGGNGRGLSQKEHEYLPESRESLEKREPLVFGGNGRGLSQKEHSILPASKESLDKREPLVFGGNGRGLSSREQQLSNNNHILNMRDPVPNGEGFMKHLAKEGAVKPVYTREIISDNAQPWATMNSNEKLNRALGLRKVVKSLNQKIDDIIKMYNNRKEDAQEIPPSEIMQGFEVAPNRGNQKSPKRQEDTGASTANTKSVKRVFPMSHTLWKGSGDHLPWTERESRDESSRVIAERGLGRRNDESENVEEGTI